MNSEPADNRRHQFGLFQLLAMVAAAACVMRLCLLLGSTSVILLLGFAANVAVVRRLRTTSMIGGACWGAATHAAVLLLVTPQLMELEGDLRKLVILLYLAPGAWLGAIHALLLQAQDLAGHDAP
jgi:hypothetical protein